MQALIITHLSWSNHLARGSFWGALWIHTRWGRHSGSVGFWAVTQPPPPFTKGHTFCFSGMLQPKLKQGPQELPLYSLRFESGAWPCSRWAGSFPRAPFLLFCFGSGTLEALGLSLCLPLCLHLSIPWEGVSPYVCALLFPHLLCWSVHDFPLFAEVFSALPSRARPPCPLYCHTRCRKWQAQCWSRVAMDWPPSSAAVALVRLGKGLFPWLGLAVCTGPVARDGDAQCRPQEQLAVPQSAALPSRPSSAMEGMLYLCWAEKASVAQDSRVLESGVARGAVCWLPVGNEDLQRWPEETFAPSRELSLPWILHGEGNATHSYAAEIPKDLTQVQTDPRHGSLPIWGQQWIGLQSNTPFTDLPLFALLLDSLTSLPSYT